MELTKEETDDLLHAMDLHKELAYYLTYKLIQETNQPKIEEIQKGNYYEIQNDGKELLSESWYYSVHGEHCLFVNEITRQEIEVSLGNKESVENLDPYFFYLFLKSTKEVQYLAKHFKQPFHEILTLFEELENQNILQYIGGCEYRKLRT